MEDDKEGRSCRRSRWPRRHGRQCTKKTCSGPLFPRCVVLHPEWFFNGAGVFFPTKNGRSQNAVAIFFLPRKVLQRLGVATLLSNQSHLSSFAAQFAQIKKRTSPAFPLKSPLGIHLRQHCTQCARITHFPTPANHCLKHRLRLVRKCLIPGH